MPGFRNNKHTRRHQEFRNGIQIVKKANERRGNNNVVSQQKRLNSMIRKERNSKRRRKANSEAMYANSASVPDSLIAFTNEIHMESRITPKE
jgi:hypothetical protein